MRTVPARRGDLLRQQPVHRRCLLLYPRRGRRPGSAILRPVGLRAHPAGIHPHVRTAVRPGRLDPLRRRQSCPARRQPAVHAALGRRRPGPGLCRARRPGFQSNAPSIPPARSSISLARPSPGGWLRFDGSHLAEERGTCYLALGRADLAEAALTEALGQSVSLRRRGSLLTDLARARRPAQGPRPAAAVWPRRDRPSRADPVLRLRRPEAADPENQAGALPQPTTGRPSSPTASLACQTPPDERNPQCRPRRTSKVRSSARRGSRA